MSKIQDQMQQKHQYKEEVYELLITLSHEHLTIQLQTHGQMYSCKLTNATLPINLKNNFETIDIIFKYLGSRSSFKVNDEQGELDLIYFLHMGEEKLQRKISIPLKQEKKISFQLIEDRVNKLEEENVALKDRVKQLQNMLAFEKDQRNEIGGKVEVLELKIMNLLEQKMEKKQIMDAINPRLSLKVDTRHIKSFRIIGKVAEMESSGESIQLLFTNILKNDEIHSFQIQILKTQRSAIHIGVADRVKQRGAKTSIQSGNAICYSGWGFINYKTADWKSEKLGQGFSEGEKVITEINFKTSTVQWIVQGKQRAKVTTPMLSDPKREFVPYLELFDKGDKVSWQ